VVELANQLAENRVLGVGKNDLPVSKRRKFCTFAPFFHHILLSVFA